MHLAACTLCACANRGPLIRPNLVTGASTSIELESTPFFPQLEFQCGPAALATVLGASGASVLPGTLEPLVYVPSRRGSLQIEMQAAPRKFARLSYPLTGNLDAVLAELAAGRPVLVLHNYGIPLLPRWHYAVVVGYDAAKDQMALRSGVTRRQTMSARNFMRAWDNGGRWAMVVLKPGELPANPDSARYLEAAAAFERVSSPADARLVFDAAVRQWPQAAVAWIGRGTAGYRAGDLPAAARDYEAALNLDGQNAGARNNLAMTLMELGCADRARAELARIDTATLPPALMDAVRDTRERLAGAQPMRADQTSAQCTLP